MACGQHVEYHAMHYLNGPAAKPWKPDQRILLPKMRRVTSSCLAYVMMPAGNEHRERDRQRRSSSSPARASEVDIERGK